jgi:ACT domain-containing protein
MTKTYTDINDLLQLLKKHESNIKLLSLLEKLGCAIPDGQKTIDIRDLLSKAGRQDVIEAIKKSGVLD